MKTNTKYHALPVKLCKLQLFSNQIIQSVLFYHYFALLFATLWFYFYLLLSVLHDTCFCRAPVYNVF